MGKITNDELKKHNSKESCWVKIHGKVYDVTEFLPEHPGGQNIILKYSGKDATEEFDPIHPPDTLDKYLAPKFHLGEFDESSVSAADRQAEADAAAEAAANVSPEELERLENLKAIPRLEECYNLFDFEHIASKVMKNAAWAYYSSGADDEITLRENHAAFHRVWFRPRILIDVAKIDLSTSMFGTKVQMPFYVTATALGKLGHPEGEVNLTKASHTNGVIQMIPTLASCSFDEIVDAAQPGQTQWFQLYVNSDREVTRKIVCHAADRGVKVLCITVDAPQLGRREKDMRSKYVPPATDDDDTGATVQKGAEVDHSQGSARAISTFIDPALSWKDIPWFQKVIKDHGKPMKLVLKGVQRVEDVLLAIKYGLDGVILSNHGGRQLEFARPAIEVLAETMEVLDRNNLRNRIEVYIDGGIRRGTDIIKALCLGAKGVGIGRPFLYAMSCYGVDGVNHAMNLIRDELEMNMRLIGANKIEDLDRSMVDVRSVDQHSNVPSDHLTSIVYEGLNPPPFRRSKL
ncbi:hypothetical protein CANCADRAFT_75807 [Tortispora caseinolytica NRRL Y-17796]|uniref:L-lactate dehydrogenase (cytochrome) n=1 Tax=Tortispora caseinolytica NRRL Y-17796 TaxID=767744 RepID=A0A1E4TJ84_9ASCO|nr:hypothetical protein CANCADRAFT_75807 [Tortispora caseinolytica NRRL Y-17796]